MITDQASSSVPAKHHSLRYSGRPRGWRGGRVAVSFTWHKRRRAMACPPTGIMATLRTDGQSQRGKGDPSRPPRFSGVFPIITRQLRGPRRRKRTRSIEFGTRKVAIIYLPRHENGCFSFSYHFGIPCSVAFALPTEPYSKVQYKKAECSFLCSVERDCWEFGSCRGVAE
jgi:hypothetical protein